MTAEPPPAAPGDPAAARTHDPSDRPGALEAALAEAREAEARSRRFLADAAHQLRTPIAGIQAAAENLLRGAEPEDSTHLLADVVRETGRAARLITSLLHMARLDEGEPVTPAPCRLVELCADEAERAWSLAPHLDFVLQAEVLPGDEPEVDAGAIREALANLLDNARRHAAAKIEVLIGPLDGGVGICVVDDGPGVPAGSEERIFERFVSIGNRAGSGLGLGIARELARRHGGDLTYVDRSFLLRVAVARWSATPADPGS